ncbi:MAG: VWA domain-containing protein [Gemmataceae bacterium]
MAVFGFIFNLWTTTLATALAAVSIPIIIHLLNRRRFKIVDWAAMRFLLAAQRQTTRKMRVEQIVLLAVRCLLLLLLVLAMAAVMPWAEDLWAAIWPEASTRQFRPEGRTHHILVIDGSLSMNQAIGRKTAFDKAIEQALRTVSNGHAGDGYSVLVLKDNPTWVVANGSQVPARVTKEIEALKPSHGNASLASALNMVHSRVMESAKRFSTQVIYVYTDMQRSTWQSALDLEKTKAEGEENVNLFEEIQKEAQFALVDVGADKQSNCAVVDLYLHNPLITTGQTLEVVAAVQNFTEVEESAKVELEFMVGTPKPGAAPISWRTFDTKVVEIAPGRREEKRFQHTFKEPGTYVLQVRAKAPNDRLPIDNSRYLVVTIKDQIPVLIVCGAPADVNRKTHLERMSDWLRDALNPAPGEEDGWTRLMPDVRTQDEFARMKLEERLRYDCIFLVDIAAPSREEVEYLEDFLRRGRGVVMSLGDASARDAKEINEKLYKGESGLMPAELQKRISAPAFHFFTLNAEGEAFRLPPLKAFANDQDRISIASRPFWQYVETKLASPRVRSILTFVRELDPGSKEPEDKTVPTGDPALVEWNPLMPPSKGGVKGVSRAYPAKFVLLTSTMHKKVKDEKALYDGWNYWAGSFSYVALAQELVRMVVPPRLIGQASLVSEPIEAIFPSPGHKVEATVHFPDEEGKALEPRQQILAPSEDILDFRFGDTDVAGVYRVVIEGEKAPLPFAVNFPGVTADKRGSESDLGRVKDTDLRGMFPKFDFQLVHEAGDINIKPGPRANGLVEERVDQGPEIAHWLLIAMLFLLFVEIILAWQFGHYTTVDGATAPPPTGLAWPLFVAISAAVLFAVGAYVLIDAYRSGDFLRFLPDRFRVWFEQKVLDLEAPPAGETTHWTFQPESWLPPLLERNWGAPILVILGLVVIFFVYRAEGPQVSPWFKALLGGLRFFLVMMLVYALLPQVKVSIDRQGMPEMVVLIDDSMSMGVPDNFQDGATRDKAKALTAGIRAQLKERLPPRVAELKTQLADLRRRAEADPKLKPDVEDLKTRVEYLEGQLSQIDTPGWRPSRLNLAQAVMLDPERDWLRHLFLKQRSRVHVYHLDAVGKATKLLDAEGAAGDLTEPDNPRSLERAKKAVAAIEPYGKDSQLGLSLREVINQYRGSALTAVIMVTDGVTTREESIKEVADHAKRAGVPLIFLGIGDDHEIQNLELDGLQVDDTIYLGDTALFQAKLIGKGFKDLEVPIILKLKERDGREKEVDRIKKRVDPDGKPVKFTLAHKPGEAGKKTYVIEVELPKADKKESGPSKLRLERTIEVIETKKIKVLYVEGQPRYEFRYIKTLLERENPDEKKGKSIEIRVLLLDGDPDWHRTDRTALADFPATREDLEAYDVIIMGDCDPRHPKLGDARLKMIADYVQGDDGKGKRKSSRNGAGILFIAGPFFNPHSYRDTPLGPLLPVEPLAAKPPPEPEENKETFKLKWTTLGRLNNLFKLVPDDIESSNIWDKLKPMYWYAKSLKAKERAEVLATHPAAAGGAEGKHPLIVQQLVGAGRSMFFGFEETWRWRFRVDEVQYNRFWIQAMRYMARVRQNRTELRLDRQTPYREGETIKITVTFPDSMPGFAGPKEDPTAEVVVKGDFTPPAKDKEEGGAPRSEPLQVMLSKVGGSLATYEATLPKARAGKYNFKLYTPDVRKLQPDGERPSAEATVVMPPQELEDLRLNRAELLDAAQKTRGKLYTLGDVDRLLEELPEPERPNLGSTMSRQKIWNHWLVFALAVLLFSGEWIMRKRQHLL